MILSCKEILKEAKQGNIVHATNNIRFNSLFVNCKNQSVDIHLYKEIYSVTKRKWINLEESDYISEPGEFILASTEEFIGTTANSCIHPQWHLRSTLARMGLFHPKAGWGDVGFFNRWCMEFTSAVRFTYTYNMRVGQISFMYTQPWYKRLFYLSAGYVSQTGNYQSSTDLNELRANWKKEDILPKTYNT